MSNIVVELFFRVDNNHLLLLMIHVFRENEEQLFKVQSLFYFWRQHTIDKDVVCRFAQGKC